MGWILRLGEKSCESLGGKGVYTGIVFIWLGA